MTKPIEPQDGSPDADAGDTQLPAAAVPVGTVTDFEQHVIDQLASASAGNLGWSEYKYASLAGLAVMLEMKPQSPLETMLLSQMSAVHNNGMECFGRANDPEATDEVRDRELKNATKLMGLYERLFAAFEKHRGKGQQKITVEHVTVEAGGQAIVGNVTAFEGGRRRPGRSTQAGVLLSENDALDLGALKPAKLPRTKREPKSS